MSDIDDSDSNIDEFEDELCKVEIDNLEIAENILFNIKEYAHEHALNICEYLDVNDIAQFLDNENGYGNEW